MINRVILVGRLTKNPDLRYTPSGAAVARFTLAVNRTFSNAQGEKEADFISIVAWRKLAENATNYLNKGSLAGVEGRIQTGSYEGQDGKRVYTTEIIADSIQFLETKKTNQNSSVQKQSDPSTSENSFNGNEYGYTGPSPEDDLPF